MTSVRPHSVVCTVWVKKNPPVRFFLKFFPKRLGIFNQFLTNLLNDHFYTRLQIFIQIFPTLMMLCHTKRDHLVKFYISLELLSLLTEEITSLLTSCHIQYVCWHHKSVYFIVTCHRLRSTKLSTTYANVWTCSFWTFCTYYVNWVVALNMA